MQRAVIGQSFRVRHEFGASIAAASRVYIKFFYPRRSGSGELIPETLDESSGLVRAFVPAGIFDRLGLWRFIAIAEFSDDEVLKSDALFINAVSEGEALR